MINKRRSDSSEQYLTLCLRACKSYDETSNQHIVAQIHKTAGANVCQLRVGGGTDVIHFDEANSGSPILPIDESSVVSRCQRRYNCRFTIIRRWDASSFDLGLVRSPIVF